MRFPEVPVSITIFFHALKRGKKICGAKLSLIVVTIYPHSVGMAPRRNGKDPKHPLQQVRQSLNLTQAAFAKSLGISLRALESIESGARRSGKGQGSRGIDGKLAAIIVEVYGVLPGSFEKPGLTPKTWRGRPYPAEASSFLKDFKELKARSTEPWRQAKFLLRAIDLVVQASLEKGSFPLVRLCLADWVRDALERFQLNDAFNRAHRTRNSFEQVLRKRMLKLTAKDRLWLKSMVGYPLRGPNQAKLNLKKEVKRLTVGDITAYSARRLLFEALRGLDPKADENIFNLGRGPKTWITRIAMD